MTQDLRFAARQFSKAPAFCLAVLWRGDRMLGFARAFLTKMRASDEAAKILVACAGFGQQRIAAALCRFHFGPDKRTNPQLCRRQMKARRTIYAVCIRYCQGGLTEAGATGGKLFRQRCPFQK